VALIRPVKLATNNSMDRRLTKGAGTHLASWLQEVAAEYLYPYCVWHRAIMRMDVYLSKRTVRRLKLQLVGCVCLLLEGGATALAPLAPPLTPAEAVRLCDMQYTIEEVEAVIAEVTALTEQELPLAVNWAPISVMSVADCVLCFFLGISTPASRVVHMAVRYTDSFYEVGDNNDEHLVLLLLLSDLVALDYEMLKCSPFTIATAILCFASTVMHHSSKANIVIDSFGHILTSNTRELRGLG